MFRSVSVDIVVMFVDIQPHLCTSTASKCSKQAAAVQLGPQRGLRGGGREAPGRGEMEELKG